MVRRYIVPVEPASGNGDTVVVEVLPEGPHPLDVRLVGCDGESPYVTHVKHGEIGQLKNKFRGSDVEWEAILSHFFLHRLSADHAKILRGVSLVYTLNHHVIELFIRQHVGGIKVTLGEISLPKDEDFEIDPLDWARTSAQSHLQTLRQLADLKCNASSEQDTVAKLKAQLDDFIKTKDETDKAMLRQFMELLNEKKRKIRDQSRLLACVKVDETKATAVKSSREAAKPHKASASRTSKRKAPSTAPEPEPEQEPEQSDEMDVDGLKDDDSEAAMATPGHSDDETADEDEADGTSSGPSAMTTTARGAPDRPRSTVASSSKAEPEEHVTIPARRELPFGRPATRSKTPASKPTLPPADDGETEDEEL